MRVCADWTHPETGETCKFLLAVDEGCRLPVAKCLGQGKPLPLSASDLIQFYEEQWYPLFGNPSEWKEALEKFPSNIRQDESKQDELEHDTEEYVPEWMDDLSSRICKTFGLHQ